MKTWKDRGRKKGSKGQREGRRKGKKCVRNYSGKIFHLFILRSLQLFFFFNLSSLVSKSLPERSQHCSLNNRALPPGHFSCLAIVPCLSLLQGQLSIYVVTPQSVTDQEFFPALRVLLSTALSSHQSSDVACEMNQRHSCWFSTLMQESLSQGSFSNSFKVLHTLGKWTMILLEHLAKAEYG